jgi:DNA-binding NtrC family response regulator
LRDRKEDIPLLVAHFLESFAEAEGAEGGAPHPAFIRALRAWDWPGNVRELRNVLRRAFILARGGDLVSEHLPPQLRAADRASQGSSEKKAKSGRKGTGAKR